MRLETLKCVFEACVSEFYSAIKYFKIASKIHGFEVWRTSIQHSDFEALGGMIMHIIWLVFYTKKDSGNNISSKTKKNTFENIQLSHTLANTFKRQNYCNFFLCSTFFQFLLIKWIGLNRSDRFLNNRIFFAFAIWKTRYHINDMNHIVLYSRYLHTLNRKSLTCFVRTKPRGSVVITKSLALRRSMCAHKASWLHYMPFLPHFVRGSRQLLLYMTDTFAL